MSSEALNGQLNRPKRMANIELLRVVAMMMVIVLHLLGKGGFLQVPGSADLSSLDLTAWGLESLTIVAVNVYMLISGFVLAESEFKVSRLVKLLLQVWFYSIGVALVALLFMNEPGSGISLYYVLQLLFPLSTQHYWFVGAYFLMYLFSPLLVAGVKHLSKKQFEVVLTLILIWFSVLKSIVPMRLGIDTQGYDCVWYMCVFLVAVYIRMYGIPFFKNCARGFITYILSSVGIFGLFLLIRMVYFKTGNLSDILIVCYDYNHVLVLLAAVGIFYGFYHLRMKEGFFARLICKIAPYTLGVYLLHEHLALRYKWQAWIYAITGKPSHAISLLVTVAVSVVAVFFVGILVDMLRELIFKGLHKLMMHIGLYRKMSEWMKRLTVHNKEKDNGQ